jgi:hypothetical protein
MNLAASRSVRPGVIVRTSSVIASRTFTPASLRRSDLLVIARGAGWREDTARRIAALVAHDEVQAVGRWGAAGYARDETIARFVRNL